MALVINFDDSQSRYFRLRMAYLKEYEVAMKPVIFVALLALLLAGCKRHESVAAPAPTGDVPAGAPTHAVTEPVVVPENTDVNATLGDLSAALRTYVSQTRSAPKDFQDFVNRAQVQAPPPPAGKRYAIQSGKVVLLDQ